MRGSIPPTMLVLALFLGWSLMNRLRERVGLPAASAHRGGAIAPARGVAAHHAPAMPSVPDWMSIN